MSDRIIPVYLDKTDEVWIEILLERFYGHTGKSIRSVEASLREPLPFYYPKNKFKIATHVLMNLFKKKSQLKKAEIIKIRKNLYLKAASAYSTVINPNHFDELRDRTLQNTAQEFQKKSCEILAILFSDFKKEQLLVTPDIKLTPADILLRTNLSIVKNLLFNASEIQIKILGAARDIIRFAKLKGLICSTYKLKDDSEYPVSIHISGPLSICCYTTLYGRAIGQIIPFLYRCNKFILTANIIWEKRSHKLSLKNGDPIFPNLSIKKFDSKVEENFATDFIKKTNEWNLIREPEPIHCMDSLIFPDFAIVHSTTNIKWYLEIIGFWTKEYIDKKITQFKNINEKNFILCINQKLNCSNESFPDDFTIISYKTRVNSRKVLNIIEKYT